MNFVWFSAFLLSAIASTRVIVRQFERQVRLVYGVYAFSYFITVVIGAAALGLSRGGFWDILNFGVETSQLSEPGFLYWCLLFSPFIVVPTVILVVQQFSRNSNEDVSPSSTQVSLPIFAVVFTGFSSYCFAQLYRGGALGSLLGGLKVQDYRDFILARVDLMSFAKTPFYGVIYMSLPALCCVAMFQMYRTRQMRWRAAFVVSVSITAILSLATMLKGPTLLLFGLLLLAAHALKSLPLTRIIVAGTAAFLGFTAWQGLFYSAWSALGTAYMIFFRMAHGYPFYVSLFPRSIPYLGSNYGLAIFGIGGGNNDNLLVFNEMYPRVSWVQGAVAAPAHVRAFAQAGLPYALFALVVVGIVIAALASVRRWKNDPYQFAIFTQAMLVAYYMSQTSVRAVLVESFSIVFGCVAVCAVWLLSRIVLLAAKNVREEEMKREYA